MKTNSLQLGLLFTIILLLLLGIYYQDLTIFITFFFSLYLGKFLFKKQAYLTNKLQRISFYVNVCFAILLTLCFEYINGTWFSFGQDDFTFYNIAIELSKGNYVFQMSDTQLEWDSIQYKLYVLIFGYWFKILNLIGIEKNLFFHLNIINSFIASFIAPFIYKIGLKLFGDRSTTPKRTAILSLLFPTLIYYSSVIIRDSWIIALFLMIAYLLLSNKKAMKKLILIFALLLFIFFLRKSSAIFITSFVVIYAAFNTTNNYVAFFINKIVPIAAITIVILFFVAIQLPVPKAAPPYTDLVNYISYTVNFYRELSLDEAVQSSLGLRLRLSDNPIVLFIYYIYFYLSPIPPLFIKEFNAVTIFLGIGNILWYVLSPLYFIHTFQLWKSRNKVFIKAFFWFLVLVIVMVGTATGEQRHLLFLYPIILLFSIDYILNHKKQFYKYLFYFFFISLISVILYLIIKMIL